MVNRTCEMQVLIEKRNQRSLKSDSFLGKMLQKVKVKYTSFLIDTSGIATGEN